MKRSIQVSMLLAGLLVANPLVAEQAPRARQQHDAQGRVVRGAAGERFSYDALGRSIDGSSAPPAGVAVTPTLVPTAVPPALPQVAGAPPVHLEWYGTIFGDAIGETGLQVVDLDGDDTLEVVAGNSGGTFGANDAWYVLSYDGENYEQRWASLPYAQLLGSLQVGQADGDAALEILVGLPGQILVYSGLSFALERTIPVGGSNVVGLSLADLDHDGQLEIVFCDASDLFVYDLASGSLAHQLFGFGGLAIAVGQADGDAALEIAIANDTLPGYVLDGSSLTVQWGLGTGFGSMVSFADLDGDHRDELITGFFWYDGIAVYDVDTPGLAYQLPVFNLAALHAADVEGDGPVELIYGDAQWGDVHVLDGATGIEKWVVDNPEHGVTTLAVADADVDGTREILWGSGHTSTGPDYLYAASAATHAIEWQSIDLRGPFRALDHGDVDGDGQPELVLGAFESDSGYGDGRYMVRDAATKALEYLSGESTGSAWTGLWRAVAANVDADPQGEVCITSSSTYSGEIFCYDGLTHAEQWHTTLASGLSFRSLAFADLDGDGGLELIAGVGQEHTGAPGLYVYAYEAATGFLRWRSPDLGLSGFPSLSLVRVAQVDGDSALEVLVAAYGDRLRIFDGASGALQLTTGDLGITALEVATDDLGGNAEVMVGTQDGAILRIHPGTGAVAQTLASYGGRIDGLRAAHVDADAVVDLVLGLGGTLLLHDGATAQPVWQSPYLGIGTGADDALIVADLDADGVVEAMIGTARGVVIYQLGNDPAVIFADGFESGDTTGWSQTVP